MEIRLADVVPYEEYESASIAFGRPPEDLDAERLVRTLIYGHDDWARAAAGVADIRESGFTAGAVGDVAAGGVLGSAAVAGWVPAAGWKALAGALGAAGLAVGAARGGRAVEAGRLTAAGRKAAMQERARELAKVNPLLSDEIAEYAAREARSLSGAVRRAGKVGVEFPDADGLLSQAVEALGRARQGGFTWDPRVGRFDWSDGFSVGVSPLHTLKVPADEMSLHHVFSWLTSRGRHSSLTPLDVLKLDDQAVIGGWADQGWYYIDVARIVQTQDEAFRLGGRFGEREVFSFTAGRSLPVPDEYRVALVESANFAEGLSPRVSRGGLYEGRFGGPSGEVGVLDPEGGRLRYAKLTQGQKQWIAEKMQEFEPMFRVEPDEFLNNPEWVDWVRRLQEELSGLSDGMIEKLAEARAAGSADVPLFELFDKLGMERLSLVMAKDNMTFRPMLAAIRDGDLAALAKDFAAMTNNFVRMLGPDAMRPGFYPLMSKDTIAGAQLAGLPPSGLAVSLGVASRQAGPVKEAQTNAAAFRKLWQKSRKNSRRAKSGRPFKNWYIDENGVPVWDGPTGLTSDPARAIVEFASNPDWISNPTLGSSIKTYVYSLLKLNPKLWRALVVDTVDTQIRIGTLGTQKFGPEKAKTIAEVEQAVNQFVQRAVSSTLRVPVFGAQESGWVLARGVRDVGKGTPATLTAGNGKTLRQFYAEATIPPELDQIIRRNYGALVERVRAGDPAVAHWKLLEGYDDVLVPIDDLPLELLLPPGLRQEQWVRIFRDMVSTAERFGEYMRGRKKLPKLGQDMLGGAMMIVAAAVGGASVMFRPRAAMADEPGDMLAEDVDVATLAADQLAASGLAQWATAGGLLSVAALRKMGPAAWGKAANLRRLQTKTGKFLSNIRAAKIKTADFDAFGYEVTYQPRPLRELHRYKADDFVQDGIEGTRVLKPVANQMDLSPSISTVKMRAPAFMSESENVRFFHPGIDEAIELEVGSYTVPVLPSMKADARMPDDGIVQIRSADMSREHVFGLDGYIEVDPYTRVLPVDVEEAVQNAFNRVVGMNQDVFLQYPETVVSMRVQITSETMPLPGDSEPHFSLVYRFTAERAFETEAEAMKFASENGILYVNKVNDGYTSQIPVPNDTRVEVIGPRGRALTEKSRRSGENITNQLRMEKEFKEYVYADATEVENFLSQRFEIPLDSIAASVDDRLRPTIINYRNLEEFVESVPGGYRIPLHALSDEFILAPRGWRQPGFIMPGVKLPAEVAQAQRDLIAAGSSDAAAFLVAVARRQGFDGLPTPVSESELAALVTEEGWTPLFRGVAPFPGYTPELVPTTAVISNTGRVEMRWGRLPIGPELAPKSADDLVEEFIRGQYAPGGGVWSNGYYMTPDFAYASGYAGFSGAPTNPGTMGKASPGRVIVAAAPPDYALAPRSQVDFISQYGRLKRGPLDQRFFGDVDLSVDFAAQGFDGVLGERTRVGGTVGEAPFAINAYNRSKLVVVDELYRPEDLINYTGLPYLRGSSPAFLRRNIDV